MTFWLFWSLYMTINKLNDGTHDDFFYPEIRFQEVFPSIVNAFTTYYGESYREDITKKLSSVLVIFTRSSADKQRLIHEKFKEISYTLEEEFLQKIGFEVNEDNLKAFFNNYSLDYPTLIPIINAGGYLNNPSLGNCKASFDKRLAWYYKKDITAISEAEIVKFKEVIQSYLPYIQKLTSSFEEYQEKHKDFISEANLSKERINQINSKISLEYIESLKEYLSEADLMELEKMQKPGSFISLSRLSIYPRLISSSFQYAGLIEAFSTASEEVLNSNPHTKWQCKSILEDRIKYYNACGLDLGKEYEAYLSYEGINNFTPDCSLVDLLIQNRNKYADKQVILSITTDPDYIHNIKKIEEAGFISKSHGYTIAEINAGVTYVNPNVAIKDDMFVSIPLLNINLRNSVDSIDHYIFHELNHIYELYLKGVSETEYVFTCGWDPVHSRIEKEKVEDTKVDYVHEIRPYEKLNEIINELIAQDIHSIFIDSGSRIFTDADKTKVKYLTSYEYAGFLVKDFYNTFKDKIIESRRNGNVEIIFNVVGQENFERLNYLVDLFAKEFGGFELYNTIDKIKNGTQDDKTKLYMQIRDEGKALFEKMLEYSNSVTLE